VQTNRGHFGAKVANGTTPRPKGDALSRDYDLPGIGATLMPKPNRTGTELIRLVDELTRVSGDGQSVFLDWPHVLIFAMHDGPVDRPFH
jgi:hypothetical protein